VRNQREGEDEKAGLEHPSETTPVGFRSVAAECVPDHGDETREPGEADCKFCHPREAYVDFHLAPAA
jgi:hypothetical protein